MSSGSTSTTRSSIPNNRPLIESIQSIAVVGGTHGNEYTGVWCIKALERQMDTTLKEKYPSLSISTLLANKNAYLQNQRFVDSDLNRQFTHDILHGELPVNNGKVNILPHHDSHGHLDHPYRHHHHRTTAEAIRAREINALLGPKFKHDGDNDNAKETKVQVVSDNGTVDVIIDLHSTTTNMGLTIIIPEGDVLMTRAAAYVLYKCRHEHQLQDVRCLLRALSNRAELSLLPSLANHGCTIEVGPVPQGVLRHDVVEKTQCALHAFLEFFHLQNTFYNDSENNDSKRSEHPITKALYGPNGFPDGKVPCYRSAPAKRKGDTTGKIPWPYDPNNVNFPLYMVHKDIQDKDFHMIRTGDPLFVDLDGKSIAYDGSHGSPVYLVFVNEGGYYYKSSGTGIGVAIDAMFDLETGRLV